MLGMLHIHILTGLIIQALSSHCIAISSIDPLLHSLSTSVGERSKTADDGFCLVNVMAFKNKPISELREEIRKNIQTHNGKIRLGRLDIISGPSLRYISKTFGDALIRGFSTPGLLDGITELSVEGLELLDDGPYSATSAEGTTTVQSKITDTKIRKLKLWNVSKVFFEAITVPRTFKVLAEVKIEEWARNLARLRNFRTPESEFTGKSRLEFGITQRSTSSFSFLELNTHTLSPSKAKKYAEQVFPTHVIIKSAAESLGIRAFRPYLFAGRHVLLNHKCMTEMTIYSLWMGPAKTLHISNIPRVRWSAEYNPAPKNELLIAEECLVVELDGFITPSYSAEKRVSPFTTDLKKVLKWIRAIGGNPQTIIIQIASLNTVNRRLIENIYNSPIGLPAGTKVILMDVNTRHALKLNQIIDVYLSRETWLDRYLSPDKTPFLIEDSSRNSSEVR